MNSWLSGSSQVPVPSLKDESIASLFPFYIHFDRGLRVLNCGPSWRRACPDVGPGQLLPTLFSLERPRIPWQIESLASEMESLFLLGHLSSDLQLRAQLVAAKHDSFLLLGSPWVRTLERFSEWNLRLGDFAIHDSTPEVAQAWFSKKVAVNDLRRVVTQLDSQRTELRQALETIRAGERQRRLLSLIVSRSNDAVAVMDSTNRIEWINESFSKLTGYSLEEVRGGILADLVRGEGGDSKEFCGASAALNAGEGFRCLVHSQRKDGRFYWSEMDLQPLPTDDGVITNSVAVLRDVTAELMETQQNAFAFHGTKILADAVDSQQALDEFLKAICEEVGAWYGGIWWADKESESLRLLRFWATEQVRYSPFMEASKGMSLEAGDGLPGRAWRDDAMVMIPRIADEIECPRNETALSAGLRAAVAFPVKVGAVSTGIVEIFAPDAGVTSHHLLPLIESFGHQLGQFIERRNAEAERDRTLSLLQSALDSSLDAVVITDLAGSPIRVNARWSLLLKSDAVVDSDRWSDPLTKQFRNEGEQMARWHRLISQPDQSLTDNFSLFDGRTIEAVTTPHRHNSETVGQVWQFRDVTASLAEQRERERLFSILDSTLDATNDGILVTGLDGERIAFNQKLLDMWRIPRSVAEARRGESLVPFVLDQLEDPAAFQNRLAELESEPTASATEVFPLKDRRVFELYSQPQRIGQGIVGRIWCYRDVSERWAALRKLQEKEERYRFVVEVAPAKIVTFGEDGIIRFANRNATTRFKGPEGNLIGTPVSSFFPDARKAAYLRLLRKLLAGGPSPVPPTCELTLTDASGRQFAAEVSIDTSIQGEAPQFTAVVRDVSSRKAVEDELVAAARASAAANRAKSDFLANISHEIRTPLNAIVGLSEILRSSGLSGSVRETVDSIWVSAESLLALINDLLDISKIEAGQIDIGLQEFDPADIAEQAVDVVRTRAAARSLELYLVVDPPMPLRVRGDPNRIRQVLINLLSNGVKFTEAGSVTLRTRWEETDSGGRLHYSVTDTGIGIESSEQQRIFEKFYRIESPITLQSGGVGLGLPICRSIVKRLGGSLSVTSAPGEGSCFSFSVPVPGRTNDLSFEEGPAVPVLIATLPSRVDVQSRVLRSAGFAAVPCTERTSLPEDTSRFGIIFIDEEWADFYDWEPFPSPSILWLRMTGRTARKERNPVLLSPLTPARLRRAVEPKGKHANILSDLAPSARLEAPSGILLVEDNPAGQMYIKGLLAKHGYNVIVAALAKEAREMFHASSFDLVLMDVQLPDGFGPDIVREFRALEAEMRRPKTPVIVLSAHALQQFRDAAMAAGADDYIAKPVRAGALLQQVRNWLRKDIRVLILAQTQEIMDKLLAKIPFATAALVVEAGRVVIANQTDPFDVVIIAAQAPSHQFVIQVLSAVSPFRAVNRILIGDGWTSELITLAGGKGVSPDPRSARELDRLVRRSVTETAGQASLQITDSVERQTAESAPVYLTSLATSIGVARMGLKEGDLGGIVSFAHRLKGTGTSYGFPNLTSRAARLEEAAEARDAALVDSLMSGLEQEVSHLLRRATAV